MFSRVPASQSCAKVLVAEDSRRIVVDTMAQAPTSSSAPAGSVGPKTAAAPFDKPTSDIIIRTADSVDFFVRKTIVAEASSVFDSMFSLRLPSESSPGQPGGISGSSGPSAVLGNPQKYHNGIPIVPISERSQTIDSLLRFCYTVAPTPSLKARELFNILVTARKYYLMEGGRPR